MRRVVVALALIAALIVPGAARAQGTPPPPPLPAGGKLKLSVSKVQRDRARSVALTGARWRVRGSISVYAAGQTVTVRFYRHGRKLLAKRLSVKRSGKRGTFKLGFTSRKAGRITVRATHLATPEQVKLVARRVRVDVLDAHVGPGASGPVVRILQRRLAGLHYAVPQSGAFDEGTARAVIAYRKVNGLARIPVADKTVLRRVFRGAGTFHPRYPRHGKHIEADLSRQVIALIRGSKVQRIYPTSSGAPGSPTVLGSFRFYSKTPGTNAKGMVNSSYFIRGYAVHGYASVPIFNASHGCLRVPIPNAIAIFDWISIGDRIDVYP